MYAVELKPPNILATGVGRPRNGLRRLEVHPEETASNKRKASRRNSNRGEHLGPCRGRTPMPIPTRPGDFQRVSRKFSERRCFCSDICLRRQSLPRLPSSWGSMERNEGGRGRGQEQWDVVRGETMENDRGLE